MDGSGSATITDLTVELVTNRERFEDIYPSESDSSETDEDPIEPDVKNDRARKFTVESQRIRRLIRDATEESDSAGKCLNMLSSYGKDIATRAAKDLHENLEAYRGARKVAFEIKTACEEKLEGLNNDHAKLVQANKLIARDMKRQHMAVKKAKHRQSMKKRLAKEAKLKAKNRLREERGQFWPRKVYRVVLTLDTNWDWTPKSSRRGSVDSLIKPVVRSVPQDSPSTITPGSPAVQHTGQISLSLSYSTHAASWSPRYDLSLSTPARSGTITYHAEFSNQTSESWHDAKVILSTSQTAFQSLSEIIPKLPPWQIRLCKSGVSTTSDQALVSRHELAFKHKGGDSAVKNSKVARQALFGVGDTISRRRGDSELPDFFCEETQQSQQQADYYQMSQRVQQVQQTQNYSFVGSGGENAPPGSQQGDLNTETITPDNLTMSFEESTWEETGLTATYDVPGLRTIPPSNTTRRHKIASVALQDIRLSHMLVPKLREAAFLQARLRNSSNTTLLRGPAGLTLDGSFLGNITLPRCSAGQSFSLNLGVDPAVRVGYQKPTVHHRQSGIFQKEGSGVYTRAITITNTKNNAPIEGIVLDQVPVSEDERLRVEICQPKGLRLEGDQVACGAIVGRPVRDEQLNTKSSSTPATAVLKKGGEVCWDFKLGVGRAMKLVLEYETRYPSGEKIG